jgi:epoxyqueuosine reductase
MGYLADPRRMDPRRLLPGCRSILVLALRYPDPRTIPASPGRGRLAAYAWGEDYHRVLPAQLARLVEFIKNQGNPDLQSVCATDSAPLLERALGQRAGLGWIGRNSCLIHPVLGSYTLLAEILLSLELEVDPPFPADRCGACHRCLDACPTGCLLPNRTLDSRSCISYLTIENRGEIPPAVRPSLGSWVFGCDLCQSVCPWNRRAGQVEPDPALLPHPGQPDPLLATELVHTPQSFLRRYHGSPVLRAHWRGYLRNVSVAAGNAASPAALPALSKLLQESDPLLREHAAWAIQTIRSRI